MKKVDWIAMPPSIKIYNACSEPCDMLVGPCVCGAYHTEEELYKKLCSKKRRKHKLT